ncbi:MAG: RHS repeat-associated core domain-containing protein [Methylococcaceae bacterium]
MFFYDQAGHLLAEACTNGALQKSYLWQADIPLTVIDSTGSQDQPYYLQADPLNSPRAARNQAGTVVWAWPQDAFGSNPANPDPDGNGQTTQINLRFPGQYYDAETGLHYNWNRYYDPNTGRYISVDPIGLQGGLNPYAYVLNNPLSYTDSYGLTPEGAATGGTIGGGIGGILGGLAGGAGGTLALPGGGTLAGAAMGAAQGAVDGEVIGAVIGDAISNMCPTEPDKPKKCQLQIQRPGGLGKGKFPWIPEGKVQCTYECKTGFGITKITKITRILDADICPQEVDHVPGNHGL